MSDDFQHCATLDSGITLTLINNTPSILRVRDVLTDMLDNVFIGPGDCGKIFGARSLHLAIETIPPSEFSVERERITGTTEVWTATAHER